MAIKNLYANTNETFLVVSQKDDALAEDFSSEEYTEYLQTLDESLLRRKNDEPFTYFHLKQATKLEDALKGKDKVAALGMRQQGDAPIFSIMTSIVKDALVDVTCAGESLFKKDKSGKPADELMLALVRSLIVVDLFSALQAREAGALSGNKLELVKKS